MAPTTVDCNGHADEEPSPKNVYSEDSVLEDCDTSSPPSVEPSPDEGSFHEVPRDSVEYELTVDRNDLEATQEELPISPQPTITPDNASVVISEAAEASSREPPVTNPRRHPKHSWFPQSRRDRVILACILVIGLIFALNLSTFIFLTAKNGASQNLGDLYTRDCPRMETADILVHLFINITSSAALAVSNFCAQLMAAPTRAEVAAAHARGDWLDIAVPSFRNLRGRRIAVARRLVWFGLAFSSMPLHLLWNSVFFSAIPVDNYLVAHVTNDYDLDHSSWSYPSASDSQQILSLQSLLRDGSLERLDKHDCAERYLDANHRHKDVVVVARNTSMNDGATLLPGNSNTSLIDVYPNMGYGARWMLRTAWMCSALARYSSPEEGMPTTTAEEWCTPEFLLPRLDSWALKSARKDADSKVVREAVVTVDYCLSTGVESGQNGCAIRYSLVLLGIVTAMLAAKLVLVCFVWAIHRRSQKAVASGRWEQQPLVTVGDAISSFVNYEDQYTKNLLFLERQDCSRKTLTSLAISSQTQLELRVVRLHVHKRWFQAAGRLQWGLVFGFILIIMALLAFGISVSLDALAQNGQPTDISSLAKMGLGQTQDYSIAMTKAWSDMGSNAFYGTTFFANGPQFLMSCAWYMGNALLTSMAVSHHWGKFIVKPQKLRVSDPRDGQKGSYTLSLPYRYSVSLLVCSSLTHWLLSQSGFVVQTRGFSYTGGAVDDGFERVPSLDASVSGYSAIGNVLALISLGVLIFGLLFLGSLRLPRLRGPRRKASDDIIRMPLASSCSFAISAACQGNSLSMEVPLKLPIRWIRSESGQWNFVTSERLNVVGRKTAS